MNVQKNEAVTHQTGFDHRAMGAEGESRVMKMTPKEAMRQT